MEDGVRPLRDKIFSVDNKQHFKNCMKFLKRMTSRYGDAYGLPFAAQLPDLDISSVSFQFGFVGQQPGIGYQLLRYGDMEGDAEAYEKGFGLLDFWVRRSMTEWGVPNVCYHPAIDSFEPYPFWTRMIADGMEAIFGCIFVSLQERKGTSCLAGVLHKGCGLVYPDTK